MTGEGFSVVASEVKELARQTSGATEDIRSRIEHIQSTANKTVVSISAIGDVIRQVTEGSAKIANAVNEQDVITSSIATNLNQTVETIKSVSNGLNESAVTGDEVTENISGVNSGRRKLPMQLAIFLR